MCCPSATVMLNWNNLTWSSLVDQTDNLKSKWKYLKKRLYWARLKHRHISVPYSLFPIPESFRVLPFGYTPHLTEARHSSMRMVLFAARGKGNLPKVAVSIALSSARCIEIAFFSQLSAERFSQHWVIRALIWPATSPYYAFWAIPLFGTNQNINQNLRCPFVGAPPIPSRCCCENSGQKHLHLHWCAFTDRWRASYQACYRVCCRIYWSIELNWAEKRDSWAKTLTGKFPTFQLQNSHSFGFHNFKAAIRILLRHNIPCSVSNVLSPRSSRHVLRAQ